MREPVGLILAGGRGTRMGTVSKADIQLGDATLLARCLARLDPQVAQIAVNTNTNLDTDLAQISDTMDGQLGPLAGILAGLHWATDQGATHLVSVAVDTPFFPCDLVPQLMMAAESNQMGLAVAATPDGVQGTFGLWPVTLRSALSDFLTEGHRKVRTFIDQHDAAIAPFPDTTPPSFFNINTPDDLTLATQWVKS